MSFFIRCTRILRVPGIFGRRRVEEEQGPGDHASPRQTPVVPEVESIRHKASCFTVLSSTLLYTPPTNIHSRFRDDLHTSVHPADVSRLQHDQDDPSGAFSEKFMPQNHASSSARLKHVPESWDDDYEFNSNPSSRRISANENTRPITTPATFRMPAPEVDENWDDAYEDDSASDSRPGGSGFPVPQALASKAAGDDDIESWGSGSDWSGDGDVEDLTHESYTRTFEPPESEQLPTPSHDSRFPALSHSPFRSPIPIPNHPNAKLTPKALSPNSSSFLSRLSPARKWRARSNSKAADPTPKPAARDTTGTSLEKNTDQKAVKRHASKSDTNSSIIQQQQKQSSPIRRVFSGFTGMQGASTKHPYPSPASTRPNRNLFPPSLSLSESRSTLTTHQTVVPSSPKSSTLFIQQTPTPLSISPKTHRPSSTTSRPKIETEPPLITTSRIPTTPPHSSHFGGSSSTTNLSIPSASSATHFNPQAPPLTPRRSSLSDLKRPQLKIPDRIFRAQSDIKRDMGDVKEFAACVELCIAKWIGRSALQLVRGCLSEISAILLLFWHNALKKILVCYGIPVVNSIMDNELQSLQHVYAIMLRDLRASLSSEQSTSPPAGTSSSIPASIPLNTGSDPRTIRASPKKRRDTVSTSSPHSSPQPQSRIMKRKFSLAAPPPPQPNPYSSVLDKLDLTYGIWWECAELIIELGGRNDSMIMHGLDMAAESEDEPSPGGRISKHKPTGIGIGIKAQMRRQRAVTLGPGSEAIPPATSQSPISPKVTPPLASPPRPAQWRATTGRATGMRDLTQRQLTLLRGMLEAGEEKDWDPKALDAKLEAEGKKNEKKGKGGAAARGIKELWRGLKGHGHGSKTPSSAYDTSDNSASGGAGRGSMSFESSASERSQSPTNFSRSPPVRTPQHTIPRTPSPSKRTLTPSESAVLSRRKQPLRRPSLAGIFGLGQKASSSSLNVSASSSAGPTSKINEHNGKSSSDWDPMDTPAGEMDLSLSSSPTPPVPNLFKLRGKKSGTLRLRPTPRPTPGDLSSSPEKPRVPHTAPLQSSFMDSRGRTKVTPRLAVTPENIRPLVKHARDISVHLNECIGEVREMMGGVAVV
ncbi:hypothetical protein M422DRAFT_46715 [Sphaerobolus stellatus SS14]|uniref:Uncharacterized protein n=1 Tax=Sphaerobolus stellatus (strain SS14) TaxID=990650 RepID=A0A0C9VT06_SPHS4|nr:hypothetical protein M422DRAFT_46715 [Sphaerobolus stellatus SS14]